VEEFKRGINITICQKLMELEWLPSSIEQWYNKTIALDRNWRESKRKEERLKGQQAPRQNNRETLWPQVWPRRQEVPQQWVQVGLALMEGVERTNVVIMYPNQRAGFAQYNPYAMNMD